MVLCPQECINTTIITGVVSEGVCYKRGELTFPHSHIHGFCFVLLPSDTQTLHTHTCIHTCVHTHTYIHILHTHIHTYTNYTHTIHTEQGHWHGDSPFPSDFTASTTVVPLQITQSSATVKGLNSKCSCHQDWVHLKDPHRGRGDLSPSGCSLSHVNTYAQTHKINEYIYF